MLSRRDLGIRFKFAKKVRKRLNPSVWTKGLSFYLDGVGFTHKYNPHDQSLAPRTMAWRKASDGLSFNQTSKGSHEGSGGRTAHFIVAIAFNKGVILAEQYEGNLNGQKFADFVREQFPTFRHYSRIAVTKTVSFFCKMVIQAKTAEKHKTQLLQLVHENSLFLLAVPT